jgi:arylsulfatase A-like enzyme
VACITNHNAGNNAVRTEDWRYIRYADGSEELYDIRADPNEWHNLASRSELAATKAELARWIPAYNASPALGSAHRLLEYQDAIPVWEGTAISPDDPIPEL